MSRLDRSWTVYVSVENAEHDRCVDIFARRNGSYGFEEFRRDVEDAGRWTPMAHHSGLAYRLPAEALATAERRVPWLTEILAARPDLRRRILTPP